VVHRGDGVSAFCCASILHFGSKAEVDSSYLMDHNVGAVLIGHVATSCSIQPQVSLALSLFVVPAACDANLIFVVITATEQEQLQICVADLESRVRLRRRLSLCQSPPRYVWSSIIRIYASIFCG